MGSTSVTDQNFFFFFGGGDVLWQFMLWVNFGTNWKIELQFFVLGGYSKAGSTALIPHAALSGIC